VDQLSQGATVRGYFSETEDGKLQYEVSLTAGGHTKDVTIAPGGTINEIEEEVFPDKLPSSVREARQKTQATTGGKKSEIQVEPDGGNLAHPE